MKKIYMTPEMEVIKIQSAQLLAGSGVNNGDAVGDEYTSTDVSYSPEFIDLSIFFDN